jgi:large subunit ribosomal protein L5
MNPMQKPGIEKVTVNMGVGQAGEELNKAQQILEKITGVKAVRTKCKVKQPLWGIREGLTIGIKTTLRGEKAEEFLKKALQAKDNTLRVKNFDQTGNFAFGINEYIDLAGIKYDPQLGIRGFDVVVTMNKPGYRIKRRKIAKKKLPLKHRVKKDETIGFVKEKFGVEIE